MSGFGSKSANTFSNAAPSNYIAGIGRGAMGFTTRSDIGPARPAVSVVSTVDPVFGQAPAGYVAGRGRGMGELARDQGELTTKHVQEDADRGDYSESNYDEFAGYGGALFSSAGTPYDEDDAEADKIYDQVDDFMEGRHKRRREQQQLEAQMNKRSSRPTIADQFADLKRELSTVTVAEWDAIPEVGDHSLKLKQKRNKETYLPVTDSMLENASQRGPGGALSNTVVDGGTSTVTTVMAEARGAVLTLKLDKMSDSVSGQTVVDPKGYLTDLNSVRVNTEAEVTDIKKAEALLSSVTSTNPRHAPGWVAAARVQEFAGRVVQARKVIRAGCEACPDSEDVWLEAARLHAAESAKVVLANAVRHLPTSVKIWLKAAELEQTETQKKVVLRRALEFVPHSVALWKAAIELESVADAKIMLARAVECVPQSIDMWLALARLETHENARRVLNQAREALPTEPLTWLTAAQLEEAHGANADVVSRIVEKMVASLQQYEVVIGREQWLREAVQCEMAGALLTGAAVVRCTIHLGVEDEDRLATWMDDAEGCLSQQPPAVHTARAIYAFSLTVFPSKRALWLAAAVLEKEYGSAERLEETLLAAVKHCPKAETLWLMAAKEKWLSGSVPGARAILLEAFEANPQSEPIWLAAVKLEWESGETGNARILLGRARAMAPSARVWLKSALLERELGAIQETLELLDEGLKRYPAYAKFYMMAGQVCMSEGGPGLTQTEGGPGRAREYFHRGLQQCPECAPLWCLSIRLEETLRGVTKARSLAEMARLRLPTSDQVWLESIRLERRSGHEKLAESVAVKALQQCPESGLLWAEEVLTCPKTAQKQKSVEALKKCDTSPEVVCAVARLFERDRKVDKARKWYERAAVLGPRVGDVWAHWYAFEVRQSVSTSSSDSCNGAQVRAEEVCKRCAQSAPNRGELWCGMAKRTDMRHAATEVVLKKLAESLLLGHRSGRTEPSTEAVDNGTSKDTMATD